MNWLMKMMTVFMLEDGIGDIIGGENAAAIEAVVKSIREILLWAVGLGGGIMIVVLGIKLALAKGKEEQQAAKSRFIWVLVAVLIVFGSLVIWSAISGLWDNAVANRTK